MKKILIAILTLIMCMGCGCAGLGQNGDDSTGSNGGVSAVNPEDSTESGDGIIHFPERPVE